MLMTTEQAAGTWCPMVRIARREQVHPPSRDFPSMRENDVVVAGCNRDALNTPVATRGDDRPPFPHSCRCIADQCAMWRWERKPRDPIEEGPDGQRRLVTTYQGIGYCGLAGKPITN